MSVPNKRFEAHSPRWQREARQQGLDARRWNRWFTLSPRVRKMVPIKRYASGETVQEIIRSVLSVAALKNFRAKVGLIRTQTVEKGLAAMSLAQLRWTAKARASQITDRAGRKPATAGERNPWWYR